jgi:hypothetical protein
MVKGYIESGYPFDYYFSYFLVPYNLIENYFYLNFFRKEFSTDV